MDWNDLRFFLGVARTGSLTKTATDLRVSPSTVGRRVTAFERSLGTRLFVHHQTGYFLTDEGRDVLRQAEAIEESYVTLERGASSLDASASGVVPLADSTIYEMEQRGEFPRRFALSPAVLSGTLRRSKPGLLRADQLQLPVLSHLTSGSSGRALSESRVGLKQLHRRRDEHRDALLPCDPRVDDVRPLLHHVPALHLVLSLVVDPP